MVSRCQHRRRSDGVSAAACLRCAAVVKEISQELARHQYVPELCLLAWLACASMFYAASSDLSSVYRTPPPGTRNREENNTQDGRRPGSADRVNRSVRKSINDLVSDKWRRYFVSSVTPSWFWFSVFWQALWAIVRLMIANIVGKFAQLLQTIGRQRMSEVEQQGRRAVLVYY